ncbi:MAG: GDSL-type esterase/lipase family protein [Planctomycetota bacterium]|jgi:lysophospholipase L1-like esterase|nr:GDSL-type esterase/lipase family protein [Planctomycetota bacterium]
MNTLRIRIGLIAGLLIALGCAVMAADKPAGASEFFFKDGDRIVMMGDSITEQHMYSTYLELWTLTRFPAWNLTFRNVGIGGDGAPGGNDRFKRDVLCHNPTAMTVNFGMNDATGDFNRFLTGLQGIADQARSNHVRLALLTPQPVEKSEDGPAIEGSATKLEKFSAGTKAIAASNNVWFVDQFHPYLQVLDKARAADPKNRIMGGDPVHPGPPGQALMAAEILKGLKFPSLVSAAEIDAAKLAVVKAQQCQITGLAAGTNGAIQFKRLDAALPYFPDRAESILKWTPLLEEINDYRLKVTGLKPGQYEVRLGGAKVAEYSAAALAEGVNLASAALKAGPVAAQIKEIVSAVNAKNGYFHDRIFRGVLLAGISIPDFVENRKDMVDQIESQRGLAFTKRMAEMPGYEKAIRKSLVIQPHAVELVPVAGAAESRPGSNRD